MHEFATKRVGCVSIAKAKSSLRLISDVLQSSQDESVHMVLVVMIRHLISAYRTSHIHFICVLIAASIAPFVERLDEGGAVPLLVGLLTTESDSISTVLPLVEELSYNSASPLFNLVRVLTGSTGNFHGYIIDKCAHVLAQVLGTEDREACRMVAVIVGNVFDGGM